MNLQDIAKEVLEVLGTGRQLDPFSKVYPDFALKDAYNVTAAVRAEREARGERPIGRKIGFTNRTIWAEYGVYAPIWGYVYDGTVRELTSESLQASLKGLAEPRIEPEIMFGLAAPPEPGMDEHALIRCIDWIAHGFEIVQSIFPNWSFQAADTVAGYGLHGRLFVGPRHSAASRRNEWASELSRFEIDLFRNGAHVDHGVAANVLDGPLRSAPSRRDTGAGSSEPSASRRRNRDHRNAHPRLSCGGRRGMGHETLRHSARGRSDLLRLIGRIPSAIRSHTIQYEFNVIPAA
jgi:2-oxo-3-hexenedioate decarboxylase